MVSADILENIKLGSVGQSEREMVGIAHRIRIVHIGLQIVNGRSIDRIIIVLDDRIRLKRHQAHPPRALTMSTSNR